MESNIRTEKELNEESDINLIKSDSSDSDDSSLSKNLSITDPKEIEVDLEHVFKSAMLADENGRIENALFSIISSIFENKKVHDFQIRALSSDAEFYLSEILKKKFLFNPGFQDFALKKARRRNEEQCKFVIKKGFKRLFKEFKKSKNGFVRGNKLLDELEFYRFYFGKQVNEVSDPLESFFLPGSKIQKELGHPESKLIKTVSFAFLQKIFSSDGFKQDFVRYLLNSFVDEYINKRTENLWKVAFNFPQNKKSKGNKLPWTNEELYESQRNLLNLILSSFN
jgi:hypothetical protein